MLLFLLGGIELAKLCKNLVTLYDLRNIFLQKKRNNVKEKEEYYETTNFMQQEKE